MELASYWPEIKAVVQRAKKTCNHCAIATVDEHGNPHVTPIGHIFLRDDMTGYYFDAYSKKMPKNFEHNRKISLLAVNSGFLFWFKSLLKGVFQTMPGVRLYGEVGDKRKATQPEIKLLRDSIKMTHGLKGYKLIWRDLDEVRDIKFTDCSPIVYPAMMGTALSK